MLPEQIILAAFTLLAIGWVWVLIELGKLQHVRLLVAQNLMRRVSLAQELIWMCENRDRLAEWQEISEQTLDEGTATARAIHHAIAGIPFGILEAIPATRDTTRVVHGIHDLTADSVYMGISLANRVLGKKLRTALEPSEGNGSNQTTRKLAEDSELDKLP